MNIPMNIKLKLVIDDGELVVKVLEKGEYPWWSETEIISAGIPLSELRHALDESA